MELIPSGLTANCASTAAKTLSRQHAGFGQKTSNFLGTTGGGGGFTGTTTTTSGINDFSSGATQAVQNANPNWGLTTTNSTNGRTWMSYLAGSVSNVQTFYHLQDPNNTSVWTDGRSGEFFDITAVPEEFSAFAKDEWKVTEPDPHSGHPMGLLRRSLRRSGLTIAPVGGGASAFGVSGRDFTGWMNPGVRGGPDRLRIGRTESPNPDKSVYQNNYGNFGPSIRVRLAVPWFGEGRTTVRGGYRITYQGGGRFGTVPAR